MGFPTVLFVAGQDLNHLRLPKAHEERAQNHSGREPFGTNSEDVRHEVETEQGSTEVKIPSDRPNSERTGDLRVMSLTTP